MNDTFEKWWNLTFPTKEDLMFEDAKAVARAAFEAGKNLSTTSERNHGDVRNHVAFGLMVYDMTILDYIPLEEFKSKYENIALNFTRI